MEKYPKIKSLFKRDEKTHKFIENEWTCDEFEYLKDNQWYFTEKVDGTNIRIHWEPSSNPSVQDVLMIGGRTDNAQIPVFLMEKLNEIFTVDTMRVRYPDMPMTLYGEGFGAKIQKGGKNYIENGVDFALFDIKIDDYWLKREDVVDIGTKLQLTIVPVVDLGSIRLAVARVKHGMKSYWGDFDAEGLVIKPCVPLMRRGGGQIVAKLKTKDFVAHAYREKKWRVEIKSTNKVLASIEEMAKKVIGKVREVL